MIHAGFTDRVTAQSCVSFPPSALQCVGRNPTSSRVEQYWKQYAGRGGEGLGYEQFRVIIGREKPTSKDDLMRAFARLDRNGDGFITADELMQMMTKVCCDVVWCDVVWCGVVLWGVVWWGVVWWGVVWWGVVLWGGVWWGVVWWGVVLWGGVWWSVVECGGVWGAFGVMFDVGKV